MSALQAIDAEDPRIAAAYPPEGATTSGRARQRHFSPVQRLGTIGHADLSSADISGENAMIDKFPAPAPTRRAV
jgi:hypothetical protein